MSTEVSSLADLSGDLAGTYRRTASGGAIVDPAVVDADLAAMNRDGYVDPAGSAHAGAAREIREAVDPLLNLHGRNGFRGAIDPADL